MPSSTRRLSRWVRTLRPIPNDRCMSSKRRTPRKASRSTSGVHQSPSRSTLRAMEHGHVANSVRFMIDQINSCANEPTQVRVSSLVQLRDPRAVRASAEGPSANSEIPGGRSPVRFADRPTTQTEVYVAAPPQQVWPLVTEIMTPARSGTTSVIEKMPDKEERIIARRLEEWEKNMTATITGIKGLAEGTAQ